MGGKSSKPSFLWQGVLILLPVAVLAIIGWASLRQDRLLAEQEARESGKIVAEHLAQSIATETAHHLRDYREANFELHANRTCDLGQSKWAGGAQSESNAWQTIKEWQQANPEIDLAAMPPSDGFLKLSSESIVPQPPEWLQELTSEQRQLWEAVKESEFIARDFSAEQTSIRKFLATKPPAGGRANGEYLLLIAETRGLERSNAAAQFFSSQWSQSDELTEGGLPVGQLIWYQALRLVPDGGGLSERYVKSVGWAITYKLSFLSPLVLAEVERVTRHSNSETLAATLRAWWEAEERGRIVREEFRERYPTNTWNTAPFWVNSSAGNFLLLLGNRWQTSTNEPGPLDDHFSYLMFPESMVEKALAMATRPISPPPYALAELDFGGRKIPLSQPEAAGTNNVFPLLGEADGTLNDLPVGHSYPFRVRIALASPKILYARQRQRTWLFGTLIACSAIAALFGFVTGLRSFRRQLQLSEMKSNFVSSVSHELRAPIASVRLMAESLERGKVADGEKQNQYYRFIVQECRRLSSLIENVLDFSRIEQGRKQYEFEPTDLLALLRETVKGMEPYAEEKGVRLKLETPLAAPDPAVAGEGGNIEHRTSNVELEIDGRAIQQALVNLIDNAIKHSAKGQTVTVGLDAGGRTGILPVSNSLGKESTTETARMPVLLYVEDHGPGIPPAEHEKIFERFYRLGSELRRETQGVGIGLSIVRHIIAAHGGQVTVRSNVGQGSRFTIVLPALNAKAQSGQGAKEL